MRKPRKSGVVDNPKKIQYHLVRKFRVSPNQRLAERALNVARQFELWTYLSLVGFYLECWRKRYKRKPQLDNSLLESLYGDLRSLGKRHSIAEAKKAIQVVFDMEWVSNQIGLLLSEAGYFKHIIPAIEKMKTKRRGEQAEWSGKRGSNSSREVEL